MFRILIAALVLTLVLAGFIGCAKSAELKEPMAEGKASVYIYRDAIFGGAPEFNITINDQPLGKLGRNSYRRIELDAGGYIITSAGEKNAALRLLAEAGKTYYLRASHIIDLLNPRMELCVAEEKTAIAAIGAIKLTPTKKLPEIAPVTFSAEQKAKDADKDEEDEEETNAKPEDLINNPCPSKHPFLNN